jgi:hypothetical protein
MILATNIQRRLGLKQLAPLLLFLLSAGSTNAQHSNEFYNNGALVTVQAGAEVYIQGDMHHLGATGLLNNNGLIEMQGNAYSDALFQQRGTGTLSVFNRTVNLVEFQFIQGSYAVRGGQSQIGVNDGSFFNLELANRQGVVYLDGNGFVADVRNRVNFNGNAASPINYIVSHSFSSPANGSAYDAIFGLMNTNAGLGGFVNNTISTNGFVSGIDNGYVQGRLRRAINPAGGSYGFPLGLRPGAPVAEGVQYTELTFAANTYDFITGYFEKGSDNTIAGAPVQCGYNITWFSGAPHGEWVFTPASAVGTGTYSLTIFPQDYIDGGFSSYFITKDNAIAGTANQCGPTPVGLSRGGFTSFSEFGFAAGAVLLDSRLLEVKAIARDNQYISVSWKIADENDVFLYEIERGTDGIRFQYLDEKRPDAAQNLRYKLDDYEIAPNLNYYYRIKTTYADGSFDYSPTVVANISKTNNQAVRLYPNPTTTGVFNVELQSAATQELNIYVFDALGRKIHSQNAAMSAGNNLISIDGQNWAAGLYYVQLLNADFSTTQELVKAQ